MEGCEDSFDCVVNSTVAKECYEDNNFRDEIFFCDCSSWYGWTGEDCDIATSTIYYSRFVFFLLTTWSLFNIVTLSKTLYLFFKYNFDKENPKKSNSILYVILLELSSTIAFLLVRFLEVPAHFNSTLFEVPTDRDNVPIGPEVQIKNTGDVSGLLLVSGILLHVFASAIIILSWLQVFNSVSHIIQPENELISEKNIQRTILGTCIVFSFTFVVLALVKAIRIGAFFMPPFGSRLLIIFYTVGYFRFRNKMNAFLNGSLGRDEKRALGIIKRSCQVNVCCLVGVFVGMTLTLIGLEVHQRVLKIGSFNYFVFFRDIALIFGLISITYTSFYVFTINKNLLKKKLRKRITWIPFTSTCVSVNDASKTTSNITAKKT